MKRILYYFNPKNVSAEIVSYGYTYTIWNTIIVYILAMCMMLVVSGMLAVHTVGLLICMMFSLLLLPYIIRLSYKGMYEQKRFSEVCQYMEQILYGFKRNNRIVEALENVWTILPKESKIKELVGSAIEYIMYDTKDEALISNALKKIEEEYHSDRIKAVHTMMMRIEQDGGDSTVSVAILQKDRSIWQKQTIIYQKQCAVWRRNTIIAILLSMIMCAITPFILRRNGSNIDITNEVMYQISAVMLIVVSMLIFVRIMKKTTISWIEKATDIDIKEAERLHKRVVSGRRDIGQKLAAKRLRRQIVKAFPSWLLDVCIHMQTNNVYVSVKNSFEDAPNSMKPAIRELLDNLSLAPEEAWPYQDFLKEYDLPEVRAAMGMLFSVSNGIGHETGAQLEEILNRNSEVISVAEENRNQDRLGGMYGVFLLPTLTGAGKMLIDMTLILFSFFKVA